MKERPMRSARMLRTGSRRGRQTAKRVDETEELRRKLAEATAELEFYRQKEKWLQSTLETQRHARQMLEASISATYSETVTRMRAVVSSIIPRGSSVLVVSRGDQELLNLEGLRTAHFPQDETGGYAGYYPADSAAAISQVQGLIEKGAEYLLLPNTAFWWLEHYRTWAEWLGSVHNCAWRDERCAIYKLSRERQEPSAPRPKPAFQIVSGEREPGGQCSSPGSARAATTPPGKAQSRTLSDIICFPIIDWSFRFQRPQQLMLQFARAGHRVFYLSHQFRKSGERYVLTPRDASLWEVSLRGPRFSTHDSLLDSAHCDALAVSLDTLRQDQGVESVSAIVQSPFWWPWVKRLSARLAWPVVYDCMDHHAGFSNSNPVLVEQERELTACANLVVASSALLEAAARRYNENVVLVRNGCDYEHFSKVLPRTRGVRPVIGYYGAISDWFDSDLVADLAERRPDWDFILVGSTIAADVSRLSKLPNLTLVGEQPYSDIPAWLARFDVAILPFKRLPLTEAANPVKAYEILAAGKPLVSVPLPELDALVPLVRLAPTVRDFEREIEAELNQADAKSEQKRRDFAALNTWQRRFEALAPALQEVLWKNGHGMREAPQQHTQLQFSYE